jgi:hypothetical protein
MQVSNTRTVTLKRSYTSCAHMRHSKQSSHHQFSSPYSTKKRPRRETTFMTPQVLELQHGAHHQNPFCYRVLHTQLSKDRISIKISLDNYERIKNP